MAFEFNASASGTEVDIAITGVIGDDFWSDEICTTETVRDALKQVPNASLIRAFIDTDGGDVWHGFGIYQVLSEHKARVEVTIGARAQSCGSLVAMAGDSISMHESSKLLMHNPWGIRAGDADYFERTAKDLRNLQASFVTAYAARTGMSEEEVQSLMDEDRLMGAEEALAKGFCTEVRKAPRKDNGAQAMSENELTNAMAKLRAKAMTSATALRVAAMAPQQTQPTQPPEGKEQSKMDPKILIAALGLPEGATEADISASIDKLKASADSSRKALDSILSCLKVKSGDEAVGTIAALQANSANSDGDGYVKLMTAIGASTTDEAIGTLAALKGARDRLAVAESKLSELTVAQQQGEREAIIAKLESEGKCTPAQKETLFPEMSLVSLKAFAATAVAVLKGDGKKEARSSKPYAGKKFNQLSAAEARQLHDEDPELFNQLVAESRQS